eukprot:6208494-Prymnesium_polylepis.1
MTDAQAIRAGNTIVEIPISLSASDLFERAVPYETVLPIDVRSDNDAYAKTEFLQVSLTVQASTSYAVWGRVVDQPCDAPSTTKTLLNSTTTVKELRLINFTACDLDYLPVAHSLPSSSDPRVFSTYIVSSFRPKERQRFEYAGRGIYQVPINVPTHGMFR